MTCFAMCGIWWQIKLVAPPLYVMMTTALDKDAGVACLTKACDAIGQTIKSKRGDLALKNPVWNLVGSLASLGCLSMLWLPRRE